MDVGVSEMEIGRPGGCAMRRLLSLLWHDVYRHDPSESGFPGPAAHRYKLTVAEFDAQLTALARARSDNPIAVSKSAAGTRGAVPLVITVDDGGVSYYSTVADRLEERGWRGHCLVTTGFIGRPGFLETRQIRELHARGHVIGTHSVSHPGRFAACPWEEQVREWAESKKALQDILGEDVTVGSVPGGYFSRRVARAAGEAGLTTVFTSEPVTRVRRVGGCDVIGRFTIRAGYQPEFPSRLAKLRRGALFREWAIWNAKKFLKRCFGADYPRFAEWAARATNER